MNYKNRDMNNCVFTIVAKNYIGLAQILEKSIKEYCQDIDFYIVVADELVENVNYPNNVIEAKNNIGISIDLWHNMSFKYDLTEFCTSIKPASFLYFIDRYEKVIYLDPDILFYDSIECVFRLLDKYTMILTPHVTQISDIPRSDSPENIWLRCGIYNLGFCAIKRNSVCIQVLKWWHNRLVSGCFNDTYTYTFTDQKWMDFIPSFFENNDILILRDLGCNLAPWNFFERKVIYSNGKYYVSPRFGNEIEVSNNLLFVHYSGYNYKALLNNEIEQRNIINLNDYEDIKMILDRYSVYLNQNKEIFLRYINQTYSYDIYNNGIVIQLFHRRLYRALCEREVRYDNPFEVSQQSFFELLKRKKMINRPTINVDKVRKDDITNMSMKLIMLNKIFRMIFRFIGYNRYLLLIRFFKPFSRYESQIHVLDRKYDSDNILR